MRNTVIESIIHLTEVSEGANTMGKKKTFEDVMVENFPELMMCKSSDSGSPTNSK